MNTRYRIPQKVVTVIGDEQRAHVTSHKGAEDPLQNRAYAMAVLALYLGLRSSDIINLKFSQVSWGAEHNHHHPAEDQGNPGVAAYGGGG